MRNLFVKGLPKALLEPHLKKIFSRCGSVSTVAVLRTKKGASRGVGMVAMETSDQADKAVSLLHGRWLHECSPGAEWCVEKECGTSSPSNGDANNEAAPVLHVEIAWKEPLTEEEIEAKSGPRPQVDPRIKQKECQAHRKQRLLQQQAELEATVPAEDRDALLTKQKVEQMRSRFGSDKMLRCDRCWLLNHQCLCRPTPPEVLAGFKHRVIIYLHCKEFGRLSNTGGLLLVAFPPPQTQVLIAGLPEDEARLDEELKMAGNDAVVLFPAPGALTVAELLRQRQSSPTQRAEGGSEHMPGSGGGGGGGGGGGKEEGEAGDAGGRRQEADGVKGEERGEGERVLTIVLIEGTWAQARRLHGRVREGVQRVALSPRSAVCIEAKYKSPMRSQATPDRICSLTAFVMLVHELGAPECVSEHLLSLLHHKSLIVLGNSNKQWKQTEGVQRKKYKKKHTTPVEARGGAGGEGEIRAAAGQQSSEEEEEEEEGDRGSATQ